MSSYVQPCFQLRAHPTAQQRGGETSSHLASHLAVSQEGRELLPDVKAAGGKTAASEAGQLKGKKRHLTLFCVIRWLIKVVLAAQGTVCPGESSATSLDPREDSGIG